ncbi:MAG: ATP-binding protein [Spirochaetaceae bacterium]|jgi:predicted AAA+ superfamily ATPase|nr:ATP-binding protein [Spirochaetaceae bacterium]
MQRTLIQSLAAWKERPGHKPLILKGARQVGKTWLAKEFGAQYYENYVYINFDNNPRMNALFSGDLSIKRIIEGIEIEAGIKIDSAKTLLIFDEVQETPRALTSLKYFNENAPEYDIIAAGSLLGIALHPGTSFPVGKVESLELRPLSFEEFALALGEKRFIDLLKSGDYKLITAFHEQLSELLKKYYFIGGMPEAVVCFTETGDFNAVRKIQKRILETYQEDFSKHAPILIAPRIKLLWNSLPAQLARENRKFVYGIIKEGARARDYEVALQWLEDCGLIYKVYRLSIPRLPLPACQDFNAFKIYAVDVGLLSCMAELNPRLLLEGNQLFKEFKGALTEQYVLQELKTMPDIQTYYWSADKGTAEVDFVLGSGTRFLPGDAIPLEVKAERNLQAKSLKSYSEQFKPELAIRTSLSEYHETKAFADVPLYAIKAWIDEL